jgi:deoxyribose-phosphate aldolase
VSFYGLVDGSDASLKSYLNNLSGVDQVGAEARAAMLATRSIKTTSKRWAIETAITMVDLTTLEGADTPGKVKALCTKAVRPDPTDSTVPSVGAVCVYNDMVSVARTHDNVRKASFLAMAAGADFIKTSTGKVAPAATPPVVLVMLEAVRDFYEMTNTRIGVKPAGGIRTTKDAIKQLVLVNETVGPDWLNPKLFRIGASALLNDLLMQRMKLDEGYYSSPQYVTMD